MADLRLGLLGWPLEWSLSPVIHEAFLRETGLTGAYSLLPLEPGSLRESLGRLLSEGWSGLNVTRPHKTEAALLCVRLDGAATAASAVNTLVPERDGWTGHNTDTGGFVRVFEACGHQPPVLVAGAGGAARAAASAARMMGIGCELFDRRGTGGLRTLSALPSAIEEAGRGTLVNATPLGWSDDDPFPAPDTLPSGFSFIDLNYNPGWTYAARLRRAGCRVTTGERMLVAQAALSFALWTGREVPEDCAFEALERVSGLPPGCRKGMELS